MAFAVGANGDRAVLGAAAVVTALADADDLVVPDGHVAGDGPFEHAAVHDQDPDAADPVEDVALDQAVAGADQ